eukprot:1195784-Prorocentrum_minimum.AAC.4
MKGIVNAVLGPDLADMFRSGLRPITTTITTKTGKARFPCSTTLSAQRSSRPRGLNLRGDIALQYFALGFGLSVKTLNHRVAIAFDMFTSATRCEMKEEDEKSIQLPLARVKRIMRYAL